MRVVVHHVDVRQFVLHDQDLVGTCLNLYQTIAQEQFFRTSGHTIPCELQKSTLMCRSTFYMIMRAVVHHVDVPSTFYMVMRVAVHQLGMQQYALHGHACCGKVLQPMANYRGEAHFWGLDGHDHL